MTVLEFAFFRGPCLVPNWSLAGRKQAGWCSKRSMVQLQPGGVELGRSRFHPKYIEWTWVNHHNWTRKNGDLTNNLKLIYKSPFTGLTHTLGFTQEWGFWFQPQRCDSIGWSTNRTHHGYTLIEVFCWFSAANQFCEVTKTNLSKTTWSIWAVNGWPMDCVSRKFGGKKTLSPSKNLRKVKTVDNLPEWRYLL